eukprot:6486268-Amphidinium_carterae.1
MKSVATRSTAMHEPAKFTSVIYNERWNARSVLRAESCRRTPFIILQFDKAGKDQCLGIASKAAAALDLALSQSLCDVEISIIWVLHHHMHKVARVFCSN